MTATKAVRALRRAQSLPPTPPMAETCPMPAGRTMPTDSPETFDGTWPFLARYHAAPGFRMHYVDEGSGPETLL